MIPEQAQWLIEHHKTHHDREAAFEVENQELKAIIEKLQTCIKIADEAFADILHGPIGMNAGHEYILELEKTAREARRAIGQIFEIEEE